MNATQQKILYILKQRGKHLAPVSENFKISETLLCLELEKLERQELVEIVRGNHNRIRKAKITEKGIATLEDALVQDADIPLQRQIHELKQIVETLQQAIDEMNNDKPKDKDTVDKLNKYLSVANGIPTLIKNVAELYMKTL